MDLELILYVSAFIEFVTLICFFVLCGNVASIKKRIGGTETTRMDKFNVYVMTGQIERAKEILSQMMMSEPEWQHVTNYLTPTYMESARKALAAKYAKMLEVVGVSLDFESIDKINK